MTKKKINKKNKTTTNGKIIQTDYAEEMRQNYIDYAMSVLTDRVLPDVRDGLKPVYRKILYSMYLNNMTHLNSYNKCAEIVGYVLGSFHPHGDMSVYKALVRLSQDFKLNSTLIDGHGNFGSIDGDPAASMRYCLTKDSLVITDNGLIRIDEIVKDSKENSDNPINIKVLSRENEINEADMFFNSGKHKIIKIKTEIGNTLEGSENHPVLIYKNKEYVWKELKDVKHNDLLVINKNNTLSSEKNHVNLYKCKLLGCTTNETEDSVPREILQSSLKLQSIYLSYFLECNSELEGLKSKKGVTASIKNTRIAKEIQIMLLQFGVVSTLQEKNKSFKSNYLFINDKESLINLKEKIGLPYLSKKQSLDRLIEGSKVSKLKSNENYIYVKIKKIEHLEDETVYSVKVKSDCHSFVANGIVNHNTEARLESISTNMLEMIKYDTVKLIPNFNEKKLEPTVLPVTFPNLLVNGITGIAIGMSTDIPTHNYNDSIDTIVKYIDKKSSTTKELLSVLKGPDYPTGGVITNKEDLLKIYETGLGKIKIRGKYKLEEENNKKLIVITEIPYTLSGRKDSLVEAIINLATKKKELQITNIRDESSKDGMRIVIEIRKTMKPETVVNYIYKFTKFEDTQIVSFMALDKGKPVLLTLKDYVIKFVDFQREIYKKKFIFLIDKNKLKIEKLDGLILADKNINQIIKIVRYTNEVSDMKNALTRGLISKTSKLTETDKKIIKTFKFSDYQASVILETKLQSLSKLNSKEMQDNLNSLKLENKKYEELINSDKKLLNYIKKELLNSKKLYGKGRKTEITEIETEFKKINEYFKLEFEDNYAKRIKVDKNESNIENNDKICIITSTSEIFYVPVSDIPISNNKDKGLALENFIKSGHIMEHFIPNKDDKILFIDKDGNGKIVSGNEFIVTRNYLKGYLKESELFLVKKLNRENQITFKDMNGKNKKINISKFKELSRTAKGNKVITKTTKLN